MFISFFKILIDIKPINLLSFKNIFQTQDYITFKAGRSVKFIQSKNLTLGNGMGSAGCRRRTSQCQADGTRGVLSSPPVYFLVTKVGDSPPHHTLFGESQNWLSILKTKIQYLILRRTMQRLSIHVGHHKEPDIMQNFLCANTRTKQATKSRVGFQLLILSSGKELTVGNTKINENVDVMGVGDP